MTPLPRLVVAAPATGQGKTTVATGLMAALAAAGHVVSGHKVGPDYIDPGFHVLAVRRGGRYAYRPRGTHRLRADERRGGAQRVSDTVGDHDHASGQHSRAVSCARSR